MLPTINTIATIQRKTTRHTQDNKQITSLSLSVGEKNKKGEYDNFYFDATFWEKSAEFVDQYFNECDLIAIKGDLITTSYEKDGKKVYKTEVKLPRASFAPKAKNVSSNQQQEQQHNSQQHSIPEIEIESDQIPF